MEAEVLQRLKVASDQLTGQFAEAQAEWNSEKAAMERRVADAEDQVGILRRELDRSMRKCRGPGPLPILSPKMRRSR